MGRVMFGQKLSSTRTRCSAPSAAQRVTTRSSHGWRSLARQLPDPKRRAAGLTESARWILPLRILRR